MGLPPMNQFDASATPMTSCFTTKPDLTPYDGRAEQHSARPAQSRSWRTSATRGSGTGPKSRSKLPLDDIDEADEDTLNRILWHAARGRDDTYPAWAVLLEEEEQEERQEQPLLK